MRRGGDGGGEGVMCVEGVKYVEDNPSQSARNAHGGC